MKRIISLFLFTAIIFTCFAAVSFANSSTDSVKTDLNNEISTAALPPVINMYGIYSGTELDYGVDYKVIAAADAECTISLYVDSEIYDSADSVQSHEFVLTALPAGAHTIKASARINENENFTDEVNFNVLSSKSTTIMSTKFENEKGAFYIYNSDGGYVPTPNVEGEYSYMFTIPGKDGKATSFVATTESNQDPNLNKQDRLFEYDLYVDDAGDIAGEWNIITYINGIYQRMYTMEKTADSELPFIKDASGKTYPAELGKWYHYTVKLSVPNKRMETFVDIDGTGTPISLGVLEWTSANKATDLRILTGGTGEPALYIDNLSLARQDPAAYPESVKLYMGSDDYALSEAPSAPDKMTVTFSTSIDRSIVDNTVILENGTAVDANSYSAAYDSSSKTATLVFAPALKGNTNYKITIGEFDFEFTTAKGKPTINLYGIYSGTALDYGADSKVIAIANHECTISLYIDDEIYDSADFTKSHEFVLKGLSGGVHKIKASAKINENEYFSKEVTFSVLSSKLTTIMSTKFQEEKGTFWIYNDNGGYVPTPNSESEYSYMFTIPGKDGKATSFVATTESTQDPNLNKQDRLFEYDLYVDNAGDIAGAWNVKTYINGISQSMYALEKTADSALPFIKDASGKIYPAELGRWYHYTVKISVPNKRMETFVDIDGTGSLISLGVLEWTSASAATDFRVLTGGTGNPVIFIDNLSVIRPDYSACIESIETISNSDSEADNYRKTHIFAKFNVAMMEGTVNKDNITVKANDENIEIDKIEYDAQKKGALISFKRPLKSNADYTVIVSKNIRTSTNMNQPNDIVVKFNTGFNDVDVKKFGARVKGSTISKLSDIKQGDDVTFEYTLLNNTSKVFDTEVIIFVVYENNTLVYFEIKPLSGISLTGDKDAVISSSSYRAGATPDRAEAYIWENMTWPYSIVDAAKMK